MKSQKSLTTQKENHIASHQNLQIKKITKIKQNPKINDKTSPTLTNHNKSAKE